jgi:hypothetical protein
MGFYVFGIYLFAPLWRINFSEKLGCSTKLLKTNKIKNFLL